MGKEEEAIIMMEEHENKNHRIDHARRQVDEVLDVMRTNVNSMMERENRLTDLDSRANNLEQSSIQFSQSSRRLRKKYWWQNLKMKLILGGVCIVVIIIIVLIAYFSLHHGGGGGGGGGSSNHTLKAF